MSDLSDVTRIVDTREFYVPLTGTVQHIKVLPDGVRTFRPTLLVISYRYDNLLGERNTPRWRFWKVNITGETAGRIVWAGEGSLLDEAPEFYERMRLAVESVRP